MEEVFDGLNTVLHGTAFDPKLVALVAGTALVIWLLTRKSDKEAEERAARKRQERLARERRDAWVDQQMKKEMNEAEMRAVDDVSRFGPY